jgi:hypothetical protein
MLANVGYADRAELEKSFLNDRFMKTSQAGTRGAIAASFVMLS